MTENLSTREILVKFWSREWINFFQ